MNYLNEFSRNSLMFDLVCYALFSYKGLEELPDLELKKLWKLHLSHR